MVRFRTAFVSLLTAASYAIAAPSACLSQASIEDVAECLETYTVPALTDTSPDCSNIGNPVDNQGTEWIAAVTTLMGTSSPNNCTSYALGSSLTSDFAFALYTESASSKTFCLLYETASSASQSTKFKHGWGFVIVPADSGNVFHTLHFSAPHPKFDQNTVKQAAALFKMTGGKSMVASGRHRRACSKVTDCSGSGDANAPNYETDAAHDDVSSLILTISVLALIIALA